MDGISWYFLRIGIPVLASVLSAIFNKAMSVGLFPRNWKIAVVAPIFKEGPNDDRSDKKSFSVLPVVSRLCEKTIFDKLRAYYDDNKFFYSNRSKFEPCTWFWRVYCRLVMTGTMTLTKDSLHLRYLLTWKELWYCRSCNSYSEASSMWSIGRGDELFKVILTRS